MRWLTADTSLSGELFPWYRSNKVGAVDEMHGGAGDDTLEGSFGT